MLAVRTHRLGIGEVKAAQGLAGRLQTARGLIGSPHSVLQLPVSLSRHGRATDLDDIARRELHDLANAMSLSVDFDAGPRPATFRLRSTGASQSVSVVIPSAGARDSDGQRLARSAIEGVLGEEGIEYEVLVVVGDEFDGDPTELVVDSRVRLVPRPPGRFNFAVAANTGLMAATNDLALLLNDDTRAIESGWLSQLSLHLDDPSVGAVGPALLYPDSTIQHVGMIIDDARPLHPFIGQTLADVGRHGWDVAHDVVAATGACLMVRRTDALAVGGLSIGFPLSFNDVDLCLKLRRLGRRVVVDPSSTLIHHESASREPVIEKWEWDRYILRWGQINDPWYHPDHHRPDDPENLSRNADHLEPAATALPNGIGRDTKIRPRVHHARVADAEV